MIFGKHIIRLLGYERVYLLLCKVADTPFHIQEDYMIPSSNEQTCTFIVC